MLLDYYLTIWAAIKREQGLQKFISIENYELNPVWKDTIKSRKLFNPKHILGILVTTLFLYYLIELDDDDIASSMFFMGSFIGAYGMIIGRHISNLFIFYFVISNSNCISGNISLDNKYMLYTSLFQFLSATTPLVFIAMVYQKPFVIGSACGSFFIILAHVIWIRKNNKGSKA